MYNTLKCQISQGRHCHFTKEAFNPPSLSLIQVHFCDFLEIASWYWPDLAIIQATKLGLGRISLNFRQKCGFQENSNFSNSLKIEAQCSIYGAKSKIIKAANTSKLFQEKSKKSFLFFFILIAQFHSILLNSIPAWIIFPSGGFYFMTKYAKLLCNLFEYFSRF